MNQNRFGHPGAQRRIPLAVSPQGWMPGMSGMGEEAQPGSDAAANGQAMFGLPPQDFINALYDIFGKYPRTNVLPYWNSFTLNAANGNQLTALGTQRPNVQTTSDAAHIITQFTGASTGSYTVFLRTDSSDRQLMRIPIHSDSIVGTAEFPYPLPKPLLLAPNTTVSFDIVDLSGQPNDVWFTLAGFKVYRRQYAAAG
jgi:hypothetical protein